MSPINSERGKKTRQTEEKVRRQHQELDRPGVHQVQDGSGEQGKMKETGSEIICGAPTTLAVKGKIMMMIKMNFITVRVKYSTKTKLRRTITKVGVNMHREVNFGRKNKLFPVGCLDDMIILA